jgi:hypothetical protein
MRLWLVNMCNIYATATAQVHFRKLLHGINRESLLSEKLFGKAPAEFSRESALEALPNRALASPGELFLRGKVKKQLHLGSSEPVWYKKLKDSFCEAGVKAIPSTPSGSY